MFGRKVVIVLAMAVGFGPAVAHAQYGTGAAGAAAGAAGNAAYGAGTAAGGAAYGAGNTVAGATGGWGSDVVNRIYDRPSSAYAYDAPDVDLYFGASIPTAHWNDYVNTGGVVGAFAGYRWGLADNVALGVVVNPSFSIGGTELGGNCRYTYCSGKETSSTFSIGVGPKLSFIEGPTQMALAVTGAYFRDIAGVLDSNGAGLAIHASVTRDLGWYGLNAGIFGRLEEQFLSPYPGNGDGGNWNGRRNDGVNDRQMIMAGLQLGWNGPAPVLAAPVPPPPPPAPMRKKIVLRGVNFDYDKATLQPAGRPILDEAAEILKANPDVNVEVRGYTDSRGSDAYNMRLSERRAQTVKNYLVSRGVSPSRLTTRGYGESDPVATNETAAGRAQNRRVELIPQ
ncbi:MAG: OmpA family protein [Alphaproteobacteria bacterium]